MGKTSLINAAAQSKVGKVGVIDAVTAQHHEYDVVRNGKKYRFLDTVGLEDTKDSDEEDAKEFTNEEILKKIEQKMMFFPKQTKIVFLLVPMCRATENPY